MVIPGEQSQNVRSLDGGRAFAVSRAIMGGPANSAANSAASATAILDRFLHHSDIIQITGKSYRLGIREKMPKDTKVPTGSPPDK
jgi:hypothetical protein